MVRNYIISVWSEQHLFTAGHLQDRRQQQMLVATPILIAVVLVVSAWPAAAAAAPPPTPTPYGGNGNASCQRQCGALEIPYPFGIGRGCYHYTGEGDITFELTCRRTAGGGYQAFCGESVEVIDINVRRAQASINSGILSWCYNRSSRSMFYKTTWDGFDLSDSQFQLSDEGNRLIVVGCNSLSYVQGAIGNGTVYMTGCMATCPDAGILVNGSCAGMGCCQAAIPRGINTYGVEFDDRFNTSTVTGFSPCSYAVLMEATAFDFRTSYVTTEDFLESTGGKVPMVLDWVVGTETCREAKRNATAYMCVSSNSECVDSKNGAGGYLCNCSTGYQGNPYIPAGCQDIDECLHDNANNCTSIGATICQNTEGSYKCLCPQGKRMVNDRCMAKSFSLGISIVIAVSSGTIVLLLVLFGIIITRKHKRLKTKRLKQKFFKQNRGQLLQQLVAQRADIAERMIIPLEELEKATNKFDKARKLGDGGHSTVYKGILSDLHVVAIKKSKIAVQREIDDFINEVAILSQISHINVVKLFGCCLETEVPLLVYEFVSNGTLYHHLHVTESKSLAWEDRLRIATETAKAIAYLHSAVSIPIIHRDIKSTNILLDDTLTSKVSDFGASRHIQFDRTGITTKVQGTIGYMDPTYYYTRRLTEKSDVYSFGVVLVELLTRKKPFSYVSSEEEGLVAHFVNLFNSDRLVEILDWQVIKEGGKQVEQVAILATTCVKLNPDERPTMRQVEMALEAIQAMDHVLGNVPEEKWEANIRRSHLEGRGVQDMTRLYSLEEEYLWSSRYPR